MAAFFQLLIPNVKRKNTGYFCQHCNIELIFMLHFMKAVKYLPTESMDFCGFPGKVVTIFLLM